MYKIFWKYFGNVCVLLCEFISENVYVTPIKIPITTFKKS